jgi:uncharacterized repeat protein (TIGR03803 family)
MSLKSKFSMRVTLIVLASCAAGSVPAKSASPLNFMQIVSFAGPNGANPIAPLTADAKGALYGSTSKGGQTGSGVIFKLTPPAAGQNPWNYTLLYDFGNYTDGSGPAGQLVLDREDALYGVTSVGGETGNGTVFKLTPPSWGGKQWTKTVLYNFQTGTDSTVPYAGLIFDDHGALYGTASGGGATGNGTVFKLTPPATPRGAWTETILHSFTGTDGVEPYIPLVFDRKGALYGATFYGGASNQGVVFKLSPPEPHSGQWQFAVLYQFTGGADGANPMGLTFDKSGKLYGTAAFGGNNNNNGASGNGTVFTLTPPAPGTAAWKEAVIYSFQGGNSDGATPYGGVKFGRDGALYGTTFAGGPCQSTCGFIYKLTPPSAGSANWGEQILYGFADLSAPAANVTFGPGGALFATTDIGGNGNGSVFELQ